MIYNKLLYHAVGSLSENIYNGAGVLMGTITITNQAYTILWQHSQQKFKQNYEY
jgi:hypothetical protein